MVCCVTGHRPMGFPFPTDDIACYMEYRKRLYEEVEELIRQGYRYFITGMADGVDTDFAIAVLYYRKKYDGIKLEAALPYPKKTYRDHEDHKDRILAMCDKVSVISEAYHNTCMQKRNCYMVDKSDFVLAVWNGTYKGGTWNTIRYARQRKKPIRYLMLNECMQRRLF